MVRLKLVKLKHWVGLVRRLLWGWFIFGIVYRQNLIILSSGSYTIKDFERLWLGFCQA